MWFAFGRRQILKALDCEAALWFASVLICFLLRLQFWGCSFDLHFANRFAEPAVLLTDRFSWLCMLQIDLLTLQFWLQLTVRFSNPIFFSSEGDDMGRASLRQKFRHERDSKLFTAPFFKIRQDTARWSDHNPKIVQHPLAYWWQTTTAHVAVNLQARCWPSRKQRIQTYAEKGSVRWLSTCGHVWQSERSSWVSDNRQSIRRNHERQSCPKPSETLVSGDNWKTQHELAMWICSRNNRWSDWQIGKLLYIGVRIGKLETDILQKKPTEFVTWHCAPHL